MNVRSEDTQFSFLPVRHGRENSELSGRCKLRLSNRAGKADRRNAVHHDERVIVAVEKEAEVALPAAFAVPAIFLD